MYRLLLFFLFVVISNFSFAAMPDLAGGKILSVTSGKCTSCEKEYVIEVEYSLHGKTMKVNVPSSYMEHVKTYQLVGDTTAVIVGLAHQNQVEVIDVIDLKSHKMWTDTLTLSSAISPDGQFIAYTSFYGLHGPSSEYDGAIVYIYDVLHNVKEQPVFPSGLAENKRRRLVSNDPDTISRVVSELKWKSNRTLAFITNVNSLGGHTPSFQNVSVTLHGDKTGIANTHIQKLSCEKDAFSTSRTYDEKIATCKAIEPDTK